MYRFRAISICLVLCLAAFHYNWADGCATLANMTMPTRPPSTSPQTDVLHPRHQNIIREYLKDFNMSKTAKRVGASLNMVTHVVRSDEGYAALQEQIHQRGERTNIDADWVLMELAKLYQADIGDIINPLTGCMLPVHDWPLVWRRMASSLDVGEMTRVTPDMGETPDFLSGRVEESVFLSGAVKKFKGMDKLKVLELIGKHAGVQAFIEKLAVATDSELTDALARGRKRALEHQGRSEKPKEEDHERSDRRVEELSFL